MLAAGFVKGVGFPDEDAALMAVESGRNVMPGWASVPALCGLVEFGSFTRWPRLGNPGTVVWRHADLALHPEPGRAEEPRRAGGGGLPGRAGRTGCPPSSGSTSRSAPA